MPANLYNPAPTVLSIHFFWFTPWYPTFHRANLNFPCILTPSGHTFFFGLLIETKILHSWLRYA
jgi:glycogen synthase